MKNWRTTRLKHLAQTLLGITSERTMLNFLRDLCTLEELDEISSRWQVVEMLDKGHSYREIAAKTGMSTTTVTRIAHWLKHGTGGYQTVIKKRAQ